MLNLASEKSQVATAVVHDVGDLFELVVICARKFMAQYEPKLRLNHRGCSTLSGKLSANASGRLREGNAFLHRGASRQRARVLTVDCGAEIRHEIRGKLDEILVGLQFLGGCQK